MKWFFVVNKAANAWFDEMIRAAVVSAAQTGQLEAHCITDDPVSELADWMRERGVIVHTGHLPFQDRLFADDVIEANQGSGYNPVNASGAYLKTLIPEFATSGEFVLYTDCDIIFLPNLALDAVSLDPTRMNAVPEITDDVVTRQGEDGNFNSGVMLFDPQLFIDHRSELRETLERSNYFFHGRPGFYDQGLFNLVFAGKWKALPEELNWRPYWGRNEAASIIHFHGPKPLQVRRIRNNALTPDENSGLVRLYEKNAPAYRYYLARFETFLAG